MVGTAFKNLGQNAVSLMQRSQTSIAEVILRSQAYLSGTSQEILEQQIATLKGMAQQSQVPFTGILDGFKSSIKEMPELVSANVSSSNDIIDSLQRQLEQRVIDQRSGSPAATPNFLQQVTEQFKEESGAAQQGGVKQAAKGTVGSQFMSLTDYSRNIQQQNRTEDTKLAKQSADGIDKMVDLMSNKGIKVKAAGPARVG